MVVLHGGPLGAHFNGYRISYGDGGQHWAGHGWLVLYPNPRGSTNYGEAFAKGNVMDWGGGDVRDIMGGVDYLIAAGLADPDRLAVQGWSYGGYLSAKIVGETDRFKAAIVGAGMSDLVSMYGTNDVPDYMAGYFDGGVTPGTADRFWSRSPLAHVDRVTVPILILHGANDDRVPVGQSFELFRGLKDLGKTTQLVIYPRERHGLEEYDHQLDRLRRQYDWVQRAVEASSTTHRQSGQPRPQ
jgi:dipeptidyl aminopeptidase/acylaminoacyl peptidase